MKVKIILFLLLFFTVAIQAQTQDSTEFDEFDNIESIDTTESMQSIENGEFSDDDEFGNDEFSTDDEFGDASEFGDGDEFSSGDASDDFTNVSDDDKPVSYNRLYWAIAVLLYTILAGILVRFKGTRKLRGLFLMLGLVILGFYRGGPGVLSSFQNSYLMAIGVEVNWQAIVLFIGLIPVTYLFGKVFCGWVCYLGAIQEFLHIDKVKLFQSEKAQKVMKIIRIVAITAVIIQLSITQDILWSKIGPFKTAINLFSPNLTGYILLGIVLVSSVFIHRPFCKLICPVGLVHGLVTKIPGASVLGINDSCAGCKTCSTSCQINAITREGKTSKLDNEECIRCGDCMDDCNIKSISFYKKGEQHNDKIILKGIKKLNIS